MSPESPRSAPPDKDSTLGGVGDGWFRAIDPRSEACHVELRRRDDGGMDLRACDVPGVVRAWTQAEWEAWLDGERRVNDEPAVE